MQSGTVWINTLLPRFYGFLSEVQAAGFIGGETQKLTWNLVKSFNQKKLYHRLYSGGRQEEYASWLKSQAGEIEVCEGEQSERRGHRGRGLWYKGAEASSIIEKRAAGAKHRLVRRYSRGVKNWYTCPSSADTHLRKNWIVTRCGENSQRDKVADIFCLPLGF